MENLKKAYEIIFGQEAEQLADWQMAEAIVGKFDVQKMGESLAREIIFEIVGQVQFLSEATKKKVVGRAESLATEFMAEFGPDSEPNMDEMDYLQRKQKGSLK